MQFAPPWYELSLTFITVPDGVAVDVEVLVVEEEQAQPRLEGVDRHDEQDAHDPPLLGRVRVVSEVLVDLRKEDLVNKKMGTAGNQMEPTSGFESTKSLFFEPIRISSTQIPFVK